MTAASILTFNQSPPNWEDNLAGNQNSGRRPGHGKSAAEHKLAGTYRPGRHGPRAERDGTLFTPPPKPTGRVVASVRSQSQWIKSAADERAVRDGYRFNEALANHVDVCFKKYLRHSKGQWAGQPFELTDWQREAIIWPLFGWVDDKGHRRFKRTYIEIPKKNYKSTTAAGVGLYMLTCDAEAGAEIYSLGADRDQASVVHNEAITMASADGPLQNFLQINRTTKTITFNQTNSVYRALSGGPKGKHGLNIHCAIADELHEWRGDELWNSIKYGFRARTQPLLFVITNAGDNLDSVCGWQHDKARAILAEKIYDPAFFALISSAPRDDALAEMESVAAGATEIPVARSCNPGMGHVINERDVVDEITDALQTPSAIPNFLRLTYSVWVTGGEPWLDWGKWKSCHDPAAGQLLFDGKRWNYDSDFLTGKTCAAGLDLSKSLDFTACSMVFPNDDGNEFWTLPMFWLPEETAIKRNKFADFEQWAEAGFMRLLPGAVVDYDAVLEDILDVAKMFNFHEILYDPWNAEGFRQRLESNGQFCSKFDQAPKNFASPTDEFERLILDGKLHHTANEILTWQAGHCEVKSDLNGNIRPIKRKAGDFRTVDGIVAAVMGLHGALNVVPSAGFYDNKTLEWS